MSELKVGQKAPSFSLEDHDGSIVSLKDLNDKWVVLYFYPRDNTPGCTVEAVDFTQHHKEFDKKNTIVMGVSPDSCKSHVKFIADHKLKLWLLSDPEKATCKAYGCLKKKKMYGKEYMGVHRSTFIIDPKGIIKHIWYGVKVEAHVKDVLETLKKLH